VIFETLYESSQRKELLLVENGFCHWHLCTQGSKRGQLTIREIISTKRGAGSLMLRQLEATPGATSLFAKCPAGLPANEWYSKRGFHVERMEMTKTGRNLICWRKDLTHQERRPNVGNMEIIYCADGNPRFAQIAIDAGMLYGAQLPNSIAYKPYFVDQNWKAPDRAAYMAKLAEYRPVMATVLDWERWSQLDEVLSWAEEAAQYVQTVIIIPKVHGGITELPRMIGGKRMRLGYSVPTRFGGTTVPVSEFAGWPVHLLGGSPEKQMALYKLMDIWSVDTNYTQKMAIQYGQYWTPVQTVGRVKHWPRLDEVDSCATADVPYEAFRRSCANIMAAWRELVTQPRAGLPVERQLTLPIPAREMAG
jgi:hypothetical protein